MPRHTGARLRRGVGVPLHADPYLPFHRQMVLLKLTQIPVEYYCYAYIAMLYARGRNFNQFLHDVTPLVDSLLIMLQVQ